MELLHKQHGLRASLITVANDINDTHNVKMWCTRDRDRVLQKTRLKASR